MSFLKIFIVSFVSIFVYILLSDKLFSKKDDKEGKE